MKLADRIRTRIDASGPHEKNELLVLAVQEIDRLRNALTDACEMRAALCRNGDDDEPPKDPATWDKPLKRWLAALTHGETKTDTLSDTEQARSEQPACHATETLCSTCGNDFRKCVAMTPNV